MTPASLTYSATIPGSPSRAIFLLQIQFWWQKHGGVVIVPVVEDISVTV